MATEDEGTASVEQSAEGGQSGRDGVDADDFGLEIDGGGVDAAVAVGGGGEGRASLIGGKGRVFDEEELGADLQGAVGSLAAMHPDGGAVGDLLRGGEAVVGHREANPIHDIPELGVLGGVEYDLVATDGGTRGARHGVDGLDAVEKGELVALIESVVVVDNGLRELADSGVGVDGQGAQTDAAHKDIGGVLGHADAGETATRNLIRCEDGTAVKTDGLGDIDLDHVDVGLDEGVEYGHLGRQVLVATAQHAVELLVDGGEVAPLGATVHLPCAAAWDGGFDRQLADDGTRAGLAVEELAYLTTDFGVCSKDFCHCVFLSLLKGLTFGYSSSRLSDMCTYLLALKDGAKVQGWQKTGSGFVSFRWALGVRYGCVRGGIVAIRRWVGRGKKGECRPGLGKIGVDEAKKSHGKRGCLPWGFLSPDYTLFLLLVSRILEIHNRKNNRRNASLDRKTANMFTNIWENNSSSVDTAKIF